MPGSMIIDDNNKGKSFPERALSLQSSDIEAMFSSKEIIGLREGELRLPNNELYSGTLLGNLLEGKGKYIWSDGSINDGEWMRGARHGNGKIKWPSGAVYDGEFSGGYINGNDTYIGADNITYKGRWKMNLKHGLGLQTYPNGDSFEGSWIQGTIEGPGKYVWADENVYVGNMKNGKMNGKGTLTWKNGDVYDGNWLNGMMHGYGVYSWCDGGSYIGTWTRGLKNGKGAFYPNGSKISAMQELYINALRKRWVLPDMKRQNHGSRILRYSSVDMGSMKVSENQGSNRSGNLPKVNLINYDQSRNKNVSLERWSMEVAIEKVIGHDVSGEHVAGDKKIDENAPILEREYMQGVLISE